MGKLYDFIDDRLADWIRAQPLFFVATAPRDGGHVNVSPKGPIESLPIVDGTNDRVRRPRRQRRRDDRPHPRERPRLRHALRVRRAAADRAAARPGEIAPDQRPGRDGVARS